MKMHIKFLRFSGLFAALLLCGCANLPTEQKELATMDAHNVIHTLARERPSQVAWRQRVIDSIQRIDTANFTAYRIHYVAGNVANDGKDYIAAKLVKSYCEAKGGIYPDTTFGGQNPHGWRTDCFSLSTGKLLFSVFAAASSSFSLPSGGSANYNTVAIATAKGGNDTDPGAEFRMSMQKLPHNYLPRGTIDVLALERK